VAKASKKSGNRSAQLKIINESRQRRDILLKPKKDGDALESVRIRAGGDATIKAGAVSEQLQDMLDHYDTYGLRVAGESNEPEPEADESKEEVE